MSRFLIVNRVRAEAATENVVRLYGNLGQTELVLFKYARISGLTAWSLHPYEQLLPLLVLSMLFQR